MRSTAGDPSASSGLVCRGYKTERKSGSRFFCSSRRVGGTDASRPGILVFTDANTTFKVDALKRLVAPFSDPMVGGVCGRLVFESTGDTRTQENVYWEREARWKQLEGDVDSCLGANGAIYAIRSPLFWRDLPDNTIVDDFVIGMKVREQGYRMVFEPEAKAVEELPAEVRDEWRRRTRIGAGVYQSLGMCRRCLLPRYGWFAWMFWSHKVVRWFTPHLLLVVATASVLIPLYAVEASRWDRAPFAVGAAFVAVGAAGRLWRGSRRGGVVSIFRAVDYFITIESAMFVGFVRYCRGNLKGMWERTERGREGDA
jgi:cellulose synthase/poly-beta-1,6-N-acetylglucosamine synthase-like glycosyltransferase